MRIKKKCLYFGVHISSVQYIDVRSKTVSIQSHLLQTTLSLVNTVSVVNRLIICVHVTSLVSSCTLQHRIFSLECSLFVPSTTHHRLQTRSDMECLKKYCLLKYMVILKCNSDPTIATTTQKLTTFLTMYDAFFSVHSRICRKIIKMILSSLRFFSISVFRDFYFIVSDGFIVSTLAPLVCLVSQVMLGVPLRFPTWGLIINKNLMVEK